MKLFDPHIHMTSRTTPDYEAMAGAGIVAVVEPSFWMGQPRTHVGTFEDYFLSLLGWERFRASQFGIRHLCTMALNPKEANNPAVARGVLDLLPRYLEKDGVVAVGEIGFDEMKPAEERAFFAQSGRLDVADFGAAAQIDQRKLWEGNSVLRGQSPIVDGGTPRV